MTLWIMYALASALFFSIKDILAKDLFRHKDMEPKHAVFQEFTSYLVLSLFFITLVDFSSILDHWALFLLKSALIAATAYIYFSLLNKHEITVVAPLINLSPMFLLLIAYIFLGEQMSGIQLLGILVIVLATYFLEVVLKHHNKKNCQKHHWYTIRNQDIMFFGTVIAMLILISFLAMTDKLLLGEVNVPTNLFFSSLIILVVYIVMKKPKIAIEAFTIYKEHPKAIVFSIIQAISTGLVMLAIAVPSALVSLIVPLRRTSTLFTSIFGGLLFKEKHLAKKLIAVIFMLIGVLLIVL